MKRILSLLLALVMLLSVFALTSCTIGAGGGEGGEDGGELGDNGGGTGDDETGDNSTPDPAMLQLINGAAANFNVIYSSKADTFVMQAINGWIGELADRGISAKQLADYNVNKMQDCEILIGTGLVQRDKYNVDVHDFGEKGYVIKVVDEKVVICGGSSAATIEAMELFFENYLINGTGAVARTLLLEKVQDDYPIKSITVGGESIKDSYISATRSNSSEYAAAQLLQSTLYAKAGIWLDIMSLEGDTGKRINVKLVEDAGEDGFRVFVNEEGMLTVNCAYSNKFEAATLLFIESAIANATGDVNFAPDYSFTSCVSVVKYSEFGAVGDGITDDFDAIIAAHNFANQGGQRVEADAGAIYYIGESRRTAYIKTDTDWGDAQFIIDDRNVPRDDRYYWIFEVEPDITPYNVTVPEGMTIKKGDTNIGLTFDTDVLLFVVDANKKVYIRYGSNVNSGANQREMLLVDKDGNIDESTPPIFDYDTVTSIKAYSVSDTPITVEGGIFTTRSNQVYTDTFYYRGIMVNRSNTTVKGVTHYMSDEPDPAEYPSGACSYMGFYCVEYANNVTFDSCVMTGHKTYYEVQSSGNYGTKGNYDTVANCSNNILWKNCTQSNDLNDKQFWGVMASNWCKNLAWDGCALSRFDAHCGVYNVSVKNSQVGEVINLIGSGKAYFENVTRSSGKNAYFISLRTDYGSTWDGEVVIKDCKLVVGDTAKNAYILRGTWNERWFGYKCYLPNVDVDGFTVERLNGSSYDGNFYVFNNIKSSYSGDLRENATNPLGAPLTIKLKGVTCTDIIAGTNNDVIFTDTVISKED